MVYSVACEGREKSVPSIWSVKADWSPAWVLKPPSTRKMAPSSRISSVIEQVLAG